MKYDIRPDVTLSPPSEPFFYRSVDLALGWRRLQEMKQRQRVRVEATRAGLSLACVLAAYVLLAVAR